jgi:hypothetical protein
VDRHGFLGTVAGNLDATFVADAHQPQMPHRIGILARTSMTITAASLDAFWRSSLPGGAP